MARMSTDRDWDAAGTRLGLRAVADGEPTRWFEELWSAGDRGEIDMPWSRADPYDLVVAHVDAAGAGTGRRAVVVGSGYGADAEFLASRGYDTVAFDIAPSAVEVARRRNPDSAVDYRVADLLDLPADLVGAFDLVVEVFTVQATPLSVRPGVLAGLRSLLAPGGTLLAVQMVRPDGVERTAGPPWLLDREEIRELAGDGVEFVSLDVEPNAVDPARPARWRAVLTRRR